MALPVILDCDPGHDDAIALILALASPELKVLAVTTSAGNQTRFEQRFFREPAIKRYAELGQIGTAIVQLFSQHMIVEVEPGIAEQRLGIGDQRIQMCFLVGFDIRCVLHDIGGSAHVV